MLIGYSPVTLNDLFHELTPAPRPFFFQLFVDCKIGYCFLHRPALDEANVAVAGPRFKDPARKPRLSLLRGPQLV
jgi:hypothetical protein